jgi:hypothetical protein
MCSCMWPDINSRNGSRLPLLLRTGRNSFPQGPGLKVVERCVEACSAPQAIRPVVRFLLILSLLCCPTEHAACMPLRCSRPSETCNNRLHGIDKRMCSW